MESKIKDLIFEFADVMFEDIKPEEKLVNLGLDSLEVVELVCQLEIELNRNIPDSEIENLKTVQDVINLAEKWK